MPRHPNHGILPPAPELRRMYMDKDLTFDDIARKYGVRRNTVCNKLRRHAQANGLSWPLKQARPDWRKRAGRRQGATRWDSVSAQLLRAELRECASTYRVTYGGIAVRAGINPNHVYQITAGLLTRVSRRTCLLLMQAVEAIESEAEGVA